MLLVIAGSRYGWIKKPAHHTYWIVMSPTGNRYQNRPQKNPKSRWGCNMEPRTVYCNSCPCLFKDYQIDETTGETTGIWWTCGIDRFEIEFGNIPQNRVCRKSGCPLKRIELIGGTIIRPDERSIW